MSLREYRGKYKALDRRNKTLLGLALILAIIGTGALFEGAYRASWEASEWTQVCSSLNSQGYIRSIVVFGDSIYGGTSTGGRLFRYTPGDAGWTQVCAQLNSQTYINSLTTLDGSIYGGTGPTGRLFRYTPGDAGWAEVCAQLDDQAYIRALTVLDGSIYGGTSGGRLFRYTPGDAGWTQVCAQRSSQDIQSLIVLDGSIYAGTSTAGFLFRYTPGDAGWAEVCDKLNSQAYIYGLTVLDGSIYGGTSGGKLFRYTPGDAGWTQVCDRLNSQVCLYSSKAVGGSIYTGTGTNGCLFGYTPGDAGWTQICDQLGESSIRSLGEIDGVIYGGTGGNGLLFSYTIPPEPEPEPELETGGLLTIGAFWRTPPSPKVNDVVAWKLTGIGIRRAAVSFSVVDALTGAITTDTENLMYSDGVWWTTAVYARPCRVVATPYVYGESGSVNGTAIVLEILPETSPDNVISLVVEETINTVYEVGEVATRFMISTTDWSGVDIPMWIPSLMLLAIVVLIIRRQQG